MKVFGILCLFIISSILMAACAKPAPSPTQAPAPAPTSTSTPTPKPTPVTTPAKTYRLTFAHVVSGVPMREKVIGETWPAAVKEKSGGRLIIDVKPGIIDKNDVGRAVFENRVELGEMLTGQFTTTELLWDLLRMPGVASVEEMYKSKDIQNILEEDILKPTMTKLNGVYLGLSLWSDKVGFCRVPVQHVQDLKGKKIRLAGAPAMKLVQTLEAKTVSVVPEELVMALERGIVDAVWTGASWGYGNKLYESGKYISGLRLDGPPTGALAINKGVFDSLPADLQKVLLITGLEAARQITESAAVTEEAEAIAAMTKAGATFYKPSADDLKALTEASKNVHAEWLAKADPKSKAIYDKLMAAAAAFRR